MHIGFRTLGIQCASNLGSIMGALVESSSVIIVSLTEQVARYYDVRRVLLAGVDIIEGEGTVCLLPPTDQYVDPRGMMVQRCVCKIWGCPSQLW